MPNSLGTALSSPKEPYPRGKILPVYSGGVRTEQSVHKLPDPGVRKSIIPAFVLAAITLFVFYTLQDFGPGSAVRRFHEDLTAGNYSDLQQVCTSSIQSPAVVRLGIFLKEIDSSGGSARLASMDRFPNEVDVLVLYQLNGEESPFVWVVAKREIGWQVDPYQTLLANPAL